MSIFDPRLTPARGDLAAAHLRGRVEAHRYVEGRPCQVSAAVLDLKRQPRSDAALDTQLLHGEIVRVYEEENGWAWVQAERDGYVGFVATHGLNESVVVPTHQVGVRRTFVYPAPDMKQPAAAALPLAARVAVQEVAGTYARLQGGGYVFAAHLVALDRTACDDPVAVAQQLVGTPYLWGGRTPEGIDCSGLVQLSFAMAAIELPRDARMQQALGQALPVDGGALRRGDLVFWPGHVGIMSAPDTLLHANAHHMLVRAEPFHQACERIAGDGGAAIETIRRLRL